MINDGLFNDTFDNISLFVSTNCLQNCDTNETKNRSYEKTNNLPINTKSILLENIHAVEHLSLDDSIFLNDSFNIPENKSQCTKTYDKSCSQQEIECKNVESERINTVVELIEDLDKTNELQCKNRSIQKCKSLSKWGLPETILEKYKSYKVVDMFEWQVECLSNEFVLKDRKNLVYSAPTSAGKTLVAEILAIKTILELKKKVLFVLPFVSVVREKMFYFQDILGSSGIRVEGFMGSYNPPGGFTAVQVAICTIEKANSIINRLLEEKRLDEIGAIIIDEMHLLGDSSRGYQLELLLTKLKYMTINDTNINIQIIGMSATLPNLDLLAKWLDAELYTTTFRPIPLFEQCHVSGEIYNSNLKMTRKLLPLEELSNDTDNILQLCLETIFDSCSVLIFCPTKNWCENLSQQIAMNFWKLCKSTTELSKKLHEQLNADSIIEVLEQLKCCSVGLDKLLEGVISYAVAFHHAGLTMDERDIIESAFKRGALRVLVATSTLSSGVNLPARRVIIRTPTFHGKTIDTLTYRQMIGRAGRMGKDICGESVLLCQKSDYTAAKELMSAKLSPIESCLEGSGKLKRAILEVIASEVASSPTDIELFTNSTLLAADGNLTNPIEDTVNFLKENEFIRLQNLDGGNLKYFPTPLGKACLSSSMPPEEGLMLFAELQKARQCFVLDTELHIIYLVTPYSVCNQLVNIDWMLYLNVWEKLSTSMKRVGELIGVSDFYIVNQARGKVQPNTSKSYHKLQVHKRFYTALALQDLVNEIPLNDVAKKFNCSRGLLQSLQQSASSFSGMVTTFSRQLGWSTIEILVSQFQDRLQFGVSRELLDLMKLPILDGQRARALYNGGIENLIHLASSDPHTLENILYKAMPFESEKMRDGETEFDVRKRNNLRTIWIAGKQGLTTREAADMLIEYSRKYLQYEMGLAEVNWKNNADNMSQVSATNSFNESKNTQHSKIITKQFKHSNIETTNSNPSLIESFKININKHSTPNNKIFIHNGLQGSTDEKCSENITTSLSNSLFSDNSGSFAKLEQNVLETNTRENSDLFDNEAICDSGFDFNSCVVEELFERSRNLKEIEPNVINDEQTHKISQHIDWGSDIDFNTQYLNNCNLDDCKTETNECVSLDSAFENALPNEVIKLTERIEDKENQAIICGNISNISDDCIANSQIPQNTNAKSTQRKRQMTSTDSERELTSKTPRKKSKLTSLKHNIFTVITNNGLLNHNTQNDIQNDKLAQDFSNLEVIDVCGNEDLFKNFVREVSTKTILSVSIACRKIEENTQIIGRKFINNVPHEIAEEKFIYKSKQVKGLSFSWGENVAYYLSLDSKIVKANDVIDFLKIIFSTQQLIIRMFDCKEQIKVLKRCCNVNFHCLTEDPKVADWILEPDEKEKNIHAMVIFNKIVYYFYTYQNFSDVIIFT